MKEADKFNLKLVTKKEVLFEHPAEYCKLPAIGGEIGVLVNHSPTLANLEEGEIIVTTSPERTKSFKIKSGFAEIMPDEVKVLVEIS